jgi:predicted acylesterase/phospholipase RssA
MAHTARSALVLQGGGALGAYEYGAARALYKNPKFSPDLIAGVSIGAISAVLLARPGGGRKPLEALQAFWERVTVRAPFVLPVFQPYAAFFGNEHFFVPRTDYLNLLNWIYFYETAPLRETLTDLVDLKRLADKHALPKLLVSATNVTEGQIAYFYSGDHGLTLDHVLASGSLPPAFPMTNLRIEGKDASFWDGGLFDNTPLGEVLKHMAKSPDVDRTVYLINLFPNKAPLPKNLLQVFARMKMLQFANKTAEDVKLLCRFNRVAELMDALEKLGDRNPLATNDAYLKLKERGYVTVPRIVSVTPLELVEQFDDADFSQEAITPREQTGYDECWRRRPVGPADFKLARSGGRKRAKRVSALRASIPCAYPAKRSHHHVRFPTSA